MQALSEAKISVAAAALVIFEVPCAYAQAEISPDHFESLHV